MMALSLSPGMAGALPQGPTQTNGTAQISTSGSTMTINSSPGAIVNWKSFSIGAGETVRINQQSSASSILNRVTGGDPSLIYGSLSSNGSVWLINPAGIMVGPTGRIDVASLVASTLQITDADFLAKRMNFFKDQTFKGPDGTVVNEGRIQSGTGPEGSIVIIGSSVENKGSLISKDGSITLAAGETVTMMDTRTSGTCTRGCDCHGSM